MVCLTESDDEEVPPCGSRPPPGLNNEDLPALFWCAFVQTGTVLQSCMSALTALLSPRALQTLHAC